MTLPHMVAAVVFLCVCGTSSAEIVDVRMLNRGANGTMVFKPEFVELAPGDTLQFRVGGRSHNAASIDGMAPAGFEGFKGQIDEEIAVTLERPGFCGIKCSPHLGMGMVKLVKVGEATLTRALPGAGLPPRARKRFAEIGARAGMVGIAP